MICPPCGASDGNSCQACLNGNPPPERVEWEAKQREERSAKLLGQARADLVHLPDLVYELSRCRTERNHDVGGYQRKVIGSPAPVRIPVVHLTNERHKPSWYGEDPRYPRWALTWYERPRDERTGHTYVFPDSAAAWDAYDRLPPVQQAGAKVERWRTSDTYGVAVTLESWVRVVVEESPEFPDLTEQPTVRSEAAILVEHWDWISGQVWANELAEDVTHAAAQVRAALGIRPEPKYRCPKCGDRAYLVDGGFLACGTKGHEQSVRDLEAQYRRRPPISSSELAEEFDITPERIRQWAVRKKIQPVRSEGRSVRYMPWDVFCLLNPDFAAAIELRDTVA